MWRRVAAALRGAILILPPRWLLAFPLAAAAGLALEWLRVPLPWLIGPMFACAIANVSGAGFAMPTFVRQAGQSLVGVALGLYFTLYVLQQLAGFSGWIALSLLLSIPATLLAALALRRIAGIDLATAYYACTTGGAAEIANLAERHGARTGIVATAHTLRVVLVVTLLPFLFDALDVHGHDIYRPVALPFDAAPFALLYGGCLLAGALLHRLRTPNAWLFGPLLVSAALTATGRAPSSVPPVLVDLAQLLIGCSLGARFAPATVRGLGRLGAGMLAAIALLLAICALTGLLAHAGSGLPTATALLATAPGGLAEMAVTAQVLDLGVPVVVAFHTTRLVFTVLSAGVVYEALRRLVRRRA